MDVKFFVMLVYIDFKFVGKINDDWLRGCIEFNVQVFVIVRFKFGGWRVCWRFFRVFCDDLGVGVKLNGLNGILIGGFQ